MIHWKELQTRKGRQRMIRQWAKFLHSLHSDNSSRAEICLLPALVQEINSKPKLYFVQVIVMCKCILWSARYANFLHKNMATRIFHQVWAPIYACISCLAWKRTILLNVEIMFTIQIGYVKVSAKGATFETCNKKSVPYLMHNVVTKAL